MKSILSMNPISVALKNHLFSSSMDKLNNLLNIIADKDETLFPNIMATSTDDDIIALLDARDKDYLEFAVTYDLIDIFLLELYEQHSSLRMKLRKINRCSHYDDLIKGYQTLGFQTAAKKLTVVLEYGKKEDIHHYGVIDTVRTPFDFDDME
ncbi:hypothetical protein GLP14_18270 [Photobacterium carnosum]|uniref:hypothetical protein n=1 Tax=Photobacterium carnosum TaxID=2023717 RepID=UPI001E51F746|nr:hypothetical protein [Photobacterium carnosum]MCD9524750.1 hypothetical protein [Photobacterium carnosum]